LKEEGRKVKGVGKVLSVPQPNALAPPVRPKKRKEGRRS
jgi:hypothetical protein